MADTEQSEFVLLGKVNKAHGIRGEIKVYPYSGQPQSFAADYQRILLAPENRSVPVAYTIEKTRVQGKQVLLKLENCSDRTTAELLVGQRVYVRAEDLPELAEDEFYLQELQDKEILDTTGKRLGRSSHILDTGAQDILVVRKDGKEYLIPVVRDFIVTIEEERVVVDLPSGLLEING